MILRDHLKKMLEHFQLTDILDNDREFDKLWSKFDLDNVGMVRTNVFLRLLDYRVNLADEISANIQRLVSRSSAAGMIERSHPSSASSKKSSKRIPVKKHHDEEKESKRNASQSMVIADTTNETKKEADVKSNTDQPESRELSTKFRTIVQQHRKMVKQLHETDEFIPFLDRKVGRNRRWWLFLFVYLGE